MSTYEDLLTQAVHLRRHKGITQAEVAEQMGTRQGAISQIENGRTKPTVPTFLRYLDAVGLRLMLRKS